MWRFSPPLPHGGRRWWRSPQPCGRRGRRPMRATDHTGTRPSGTRSPGFTLDVARLAQPLVERGHHRRERTGRGASKKADYRNRLLLSAKGARHCHHPAQQQHQLTASHSPPLRRGRHPTRLACQRPGPNWLRLTTPWFWSLAAPSMAVPLIRPSRTSPSKK